MLLTLVMEPYPCLFGVVLLAAAESKGVEGLNDTVAVVVVLQRALVGTQTSASLRGCKELPSRTMEE